MSKIKVTNEFWVTGDVLVFLPNGPAKEIFRLTNSANDATDFGHKTAEHVANIVEEQMQTFYRSYNRPIDTKFKIEPSPKVTGLWVVHGLQEVEVDPEG